MDHLCINILLNKILIQQDIMRTINTFFYVESQYSFVLYSRFLHAYFDLFLGVLASKTFISVINDTVFLSFHPFNNFIVSFTLPKGALNISYNSQNNHNMVKSYIFHGFINKTPNYNFYVVDLDALASSKFSPFNKHLESLNLDNSGVFVETFTQENVKDLSGFSPEKLATSADESIHSFTRYYTHFSIYAPVFFSIIFFIVVAVVVIRQNNPSSTAFNSKHVDSEFERIETQKLKNIKTKTNRLLLFLKNAYIHVFKK